MSQQMGKSHPAEGSPGHSYNQILRSTAIVGVSYALVAVVSALRMKSLALMLGPAGIGLVGLFMLVADLAAALSAAGVHQSGVRQISEAVGQDNSEKVGASVVALRWLSLGAGIAGALVLAALCVPVSVATFGSELHATAIIVLGGTILFRQLSAAEGTLLQGMRRTRDIAMSGIITAIATTALMIGPVYLLGEDGIILGLLAGSVAALVVVRIYSRRIELARASMSAALKLHAGPMLRLGLVFMVSSLLVTGAAYVIRIIVIQESGVDAAGLYQSAWALAALYAGFVLQAMGMDFYPRLTESIGNPEVANRLVNEQARVSMLLAGPGVVATITLAPLVLTAFYSGEFIGAVPTLRWLCLGMMLRIVSWPVGFIMIARGAQKPFFWTEVAAMAVQVGLAAILVPYLGVEGAGMAFCGLYVCHVLMVYAVARRLTGFSWSTSNILLGAAYLGTSILAFLAFTWLPMIIATLVGLVLALTCGVFSLRELLSLLSTDSAPRMLRPLLARVRI